MWGAAPAAWLGCRRSAGGERQEGSPPPLRYLPLTRDSLPTRTRPLPCLHPQERLHQELEASKLSAVQVMDSWRKIMRTLKVSRALYSSRAPPRPPPSAGC